MTTARPTIKMVNNVGSPPYVEEATLALPILFLHSKMLSDYLVNRLRGGGGANSVSAVPQPRHNQMVRPSLPWKEGTFEILFIDSPQRGQILRGKDMRNPLSQGS